eukprot:TRINITY_DN7431_c0_g1_i2.p1 TRINITY_DN7431_c0_g1~~TRINITY_DN7431_c0_g1_i2.p1  ORF type:complete len:104 (-),score=54.07 TRINITY_DN7431_c0_g1_i2:173-484(-)
MYMSPLLQLSFFFFFKQKTAYEMLRSLVGSEMCIRDRWIGGIGSLLKGGNFQLQPFVQKFCNVCGDMVAQRFPEKTMMIKMATPMVAGMMMQMYQQHQQQTQS